MVGSHRYKMVGTGDRKTSLELVHKTPVEGIPSALHAFNGAATSMICLCLVDLPVLPGGSVSWTAHVEILKLLDE